MTNEQLVARIKAGEDTADHMLVLWNQNQGMIYQTAKKYSGAADLEDLTQEGYFGLCNAVDHYEPDRGVKFSGYASFWIEHAMNRYIDNCAGAIRIPVHTAELVRKYKKTVSDYRKQFGCDPSDRALRDLLGISWEKLQVIKESALQGQITSLSAPITDEGKEITLENTIASEQDVESDVMQELDFQTMKRELWIAVDQLPDQLPDMVKKRYLDESTLEEIGRKCQVSRSKATSELKRAYNLLRNPGRSRKFRGYYEEYLRAESCHHVGVETFRRTWTSEVERAIGL